MVRRLLLYCFFPFLLLSCNRKERSTQKSPITDSNKEKITADNALQNQIKAVKRYADEPLYYIYINHEQCFFQILVNDIPVFRYFTDGGIMSPIILNNYISHSGKQTITYRLYPQTKRTYGEGFNVLTSYTKFDVKLYTHNNADTVNSFENQKLLFTHHAATKADGKTFIGDGKDYYEYTFPFDAKVPYELTGLDDSKDLTKIDQKDLLRKVETAYQYFWDLLSKKKEDDYFRLGFASNISQINSEYLDKNLIQNGMNDELLVFNEPSFKLEPLKNYTMKLYGHGKIVCLEQTSEDVRLKKRWVIWGKYKTSEGETRVNFTRLYLHIPKGKDTFEIL